MGKYYNLIGDWYIDIYETEVGSLKMCFQGQREKSYQLDHFRPDEFSWLLDRDEVVRRGRFPVVELEFYILSFPAADDEGKMRELVWRHDGDVPGGEVFYTSIISTTTTGGCSM